MKNRNVAIVCLSHYQGGMELDAIKHAGMFRRHNVNTILICRKNTYLEQAALSKELPTYSIDFKAKLGIALINEYKADNKAAENIHVSFFGTSEIKSIYFAVKGLGCKVILRHGTTMSSPKTDMIHALFYRCVSSYVSISDHLNDNVKAIFPINDKPVKTIYNPVDSSHTQEASPKQNQFIHVERVEEGKGVFDAVEALGKSNIPRENKRITFVGAVKPHIKSQLTELAKKGSVQIQFEGFVKDPFTHYKIHKFLLFPSHGEGLGNTILEALQCGLTCITYNNTVFPEFTSLGCQAFYLAEDRNIQDLALKIEAAFESSLSLEVNPNFHVLAKHFSEESAIRQWQPLL